MLTPRFICHQDDEFVYIDIQVSHIRFDAPGVQIVVENELFVFSLNPYYLRLRFPAPLIDDEERSSAEYQSKEERINVKIPKLNKGQFFEDLDLSAKLLARSGEESVMDSRTLLEEIGLQANDEMIKEAGKVLEEEKPKRPLIEEIGKTDLEKTAEEAEAFNWEINQTIQEDTSLKIKYGFDSQYDSIVGVSLSNGNDINELDDPEHTSPNDRIKERLLKENFKFDPEYYAADYMTSKYAGEDEYSPVKDLLKWVNPLCTQDIEFTKEENEKMIDLPRRSYVITNPKPLYYAILSLMFAFTYEQRQTEGEFTSESAWSMGKLTPQIALLDQQIIFADSKTNIIKALIITGIRRSLSYPLHRSYDLSLKAWEDVMKILQRGEKAVIRALLMIREPFRFHDIYYVYNKILLEDLINWLIKDSKNNDFIFKSLGTELGKQLQTLQKSEIVFEQLDDEGDVDTELTIQEIEDIAEDMYKNQQ
jgi:protein SHQ1